MSAFDRISEIAMKRLAELERDPAYKMLQRQMEEEQRNPGLRLAREMAQRQMEEEQRNPGLRLAREMAQRQMEEEQRNPGLRLAREMAQRQMEEEQRNPGLRILREKLEREQNTPLLRIARERFDEALRFQSLYGVSNRSLEQFNRYAINDSIRDWERRIPDWFLNQKSPTSSAFRSMLNHLDDAQSVAARFATQAHIDLRSFDRVRGLDQFGALGRELSTMVRFASPELSNTFLFTAAEKLNRIQHLAELQDSPLLDQEFESFIEYVVSWIKQAGSKVLRRDVVLAILVPVLLAALQQAQSYKWRLDDQKDADRRVEEQNGKLDALLAELNELQREIQQPAIGKPYKIERTTPTFALPGAKRLRIGYVYSGQSVLAVGSTGRWILIQYTDPFNLEARAGWIRKKYAKQVTQNANNTVSQNKVRLVVAVNSYEQGEVSLGQAAEVAGLTKKEFIDVLGERQIPILNYSEEELQEEIGV
jgi:predicted HTH domain antitoxin